MFVVHMGLLALLTFSLLVDRPARIRLKVVEHVETMSHQLEGLHFVTKYSTPPYRNLCYDFCLKKAVNPN